MDTSEKNSIFRVIRVHQQISKELLNMDMYSTLYMYTYLFGSDVKISNL